MKVKKTLAVAVAPTPERKVYHDWADDALKILDLLMSKHPEDQRAIAKLYRDCPYKESIDMANGQRIPATAHTVAAWAGRQAEIVTRLKARGLIPEALPQTSATP